MMGFTNGANDEQGIISTNRDPLGKSVTGLYFYSFNRNLNKKLYKITPELLNAKLFVLYENVCA